MKKIVNSIKLIDDKKWQMVVLSIFLLQPIFELDGMLYEFLNQFSIPRPSTIFHLIIIPAIILITFIKKEDKKKWMSGIGLSYLVILGIYFILHSVNAMAIYDSLYLTTNFYYSVFSEFIYIYTLVIPYFIIYSFYKADFSEDTIKKAIIFVSLFVSILVVSGDLFLFGKSTYNYSLTKANIFTWFTNGYDLYHPRDLSSKFYYPEGNTLGIFQFILLPVLYYYLQIAKSKKEKIWMIVTIVMHSLAMIILSTKVATYGALLIPLASVVVGLLFVILKHIKFNKTYFIASFMMIVVVALIIPHSPAYVNSRIENENDVAVLEDNYLLDIAKDSENSKDLVPGSAEYNYYYIHYFEDWGIKSKLISSVPSEYYTLYYNYKFDAKFWWDVLDLYPLEQRCNGRQVQTIFNNYKWDSTNTYTKYMGMGYTTFMNGSFLIEKDFTQQRYTLGYVGSFLTLGPWIIVGLVGVVKLLMDFKNKFEYKTVMFAMSFCVGLLASYMSGHTLDQYLTTIVMSLVTSVLLVQLFKKEMD